MECIKFSDAVEIISWRNLLSIQEVIKNNLLIDSLEACLLKHINSKYKLPWNMTSASSDGNNVILFSDLKVIKRFPSSQKESKESLDNYIANHMPCDDESQLMQWNNNKTWWKIQVAFVLVWDNTLVLDEETQKVYTDYVQSFDPYEGTNPNNDPEVIWETMWFHDLKQ